MTHTPTPWQVRSDWTPEDLITIIANVDGEFDENGNSYHTYDTIARCSDEFEETLPNAAANAAHIVHCVNMHDELVAALEAHDEACQACPADKPRFDASRPCSACTATSAQSCRLKDREAYRFIDRAHKALAKAKGGKA